MWIIPSPFTLQAESGPRPVLQVGQAPHRRDQGSSGLCFQLSFLKCGSHISPFQPLLVFLCLTPASSLPSRPPPSPLTPHWSQPTLCHLRTPRDSRNGLNSVGRSPGIRHEVTSRPLSGFPALPSAGLLSACQTGSSIGPQVPLVGWGSP